MIWSTCRSCLQFLSEYIISYMIWRHAVVAVSFCRNILFRIWSGQHAVVAVSFCRNILFRIWSGQHVVVAVSCWRAAIVSGRARFRIRVHFDRSASKCPQEFGSAVIRKHSRQFYTYLMSRCRYVFQFHVQWLLGYKSARQTWACPTHRN